MAWPCAIRAILIRSSSRGLAPAGPPSGGYSHLPLRKTAPRGFGLGAFSFGRTVHNFRYSPGRAARGSGNGPRRARECPRGGPPAGGKPPWKPPWCQGGPGGVAGSSGELREAGRAAGQRAAGSGGAGPGRAGRPRGAQGASGGAAGSQGVARGGAGPSGGAGSGWQARRRRAERRGRKRLAGKAGRASGSGLARSFGFLLSPAYVAMSPLVAGERATANHLISLIFSPMSPLSPLSQENTEREVDYSLPIKIYVKRLL